MDVTQYRRLNDSFSRTHVFRVGIDAGFFSELNNMVLAMAYCLHHRIRFVLYSDGANFAVSRGWQEFFLPFCEESHDPRHLRFNRRMPHTMSWSHRVRTVLFKRAARVNFLTHELWPLFRNEGFATRSLALPGHPPLDLRSLAGALLETVWRYEPATGARVADLRRSLRLPERYLGLHVRAGDKIGEAPPLPLQRYMEVMLEDAPSRHVFLLTDDYSVVEEARDRYPDFEFATLCEPSDRGYHHAAFMKRPATDRAVQLVRLFASADTLAQAARFVGTASTNPGMHLGMRIDPSRVSYLDRDRWIVW